MATKRESILNTALKLFANEGFDAVSTKQIALEAKVSEGLIFKHFQSKKALLNILMTEVLLKIPSIFNTILIENNAHHILRKSIETPFEIEEKDFDLWRLYLMMKWQAEYNNPNIFDIYIDKLTWAFAELKYPEAEKEAGILNIIIESLIVNILREGKPSQLKYKYFLIHKYTL